VIEGVGEGQTQDQRLVITPAELLAAFGRRPGRKSYPCWASSCEKGRPPRTPTVNVAAQTAVVRRRASLNSEVRQTHQLSCAVAGLRLLRTMTQPLSLSGRCLTVLDCSCANLLTVANTSVQPNHFTRLLLVLLMLLVLFMIPVLLML
jgi:hypothetical protein